MIKNEITNFNINLVINYFYRQRYSNFDMKHHQHNSYELMYCEEGQLEIKIIHPYNGKQMLYILQPHQFILLYPLVTHKLVINSVSTVLNLEFTKIISDDSIDSIWNYLPVHISDTINKQSFNNIIYFDKDKKIKNLIEQLQNYDYNKKSHSPEDIICINSLMSLLVVQISLLSPIDIEFKSSENEGLNLYIKKSITYIKNNFNQPITSKDVAKHSSITTIYLESIFKKILNTSITKEIKRTRIEYAKTLIISTNLTLMDVAIESGFNNRQNFAKAFLSCEKMSPSQFKKIGNIMSMKNKE